MLLTALAAFAAANVYLLTDLLGIGLTLPLLGCLVLFVFVNIKPCFGTVTGAKNQKIRKGAALLEAFLIAMTASFVLLFIGIFALDDVTAKTLIINSVISALLLAVTFWNGMIRIYLHSSQLGVKWRVIGAACGFIPVVNFFVLVKMIRLASAEYAFESKKLDLNASRSVEQICRTRYPLLLVHGVFFRDFEHFSYWGRIPAELEKNGAVIYYGKQQSALSVADSAAELAKRIEEIVTGTGCGKVNIIAHSKGGLDSRYAISKLGCDKYVASLTTVNTPHRGCKFAEFLLDRSGDKLRNTVSSAYNAAARKLGDTEPDFIAAVTDLTASACQKLNADCPDMQGVIYRSIGSRSVKASSGRFPLNLSYLLVDRFDGPNDGLVSVDSMVWGESFTEYKPTGERGITHGDMIDLNRENIDGFDVRETYVRLVSEMKNEGL